MDEVSFRTAVGVLGLICMSACGLLSVLVNWEMMEQVNSRLPEPDRFQPMRWSWTKLRRLRQLYNSLCPEAPLLGRQRVLWAVAVGGLILGAWGFGDL